MKNLLLQLSLVIVVLSSCVTAAETGDANSERAKARVVSSDQDDTKKGEIDKKEEGSNDKNGKVQKVEHPFEIKK